MPREALSPGLVGALVGDSPLVVSRIDRPARSRAEIEQAIEQLIGLLDAIDGDPDFEPEEDAEHDGREPFGGKIRGGGGR
ncbi:hypothetical protein D1610_11510 [Sphingomonas gilva]|uniref:Uncharacterized protein n=2 Tax=Sphingomonas gilva TaxID=2305907 RepID=A0A396RLS3_9SPHN|nr:hypothetical protein D1610_11510 [Sphingomonas gilva]